jgi:hypothetical protein
VEVPAELLLLSHTLHISLVIGREAFLDSIVECFQVVDASIRSSFPAGDAHTLPHLVRFCHVVEKDLELEIAIVVTGYATVRTTL